MKNKNQVEKWKSTFLFYQPLYFLLGKGCKKAFFQIHCN